MKVDVLLGLQWGDEGKAKITDLLAGQSDFIIRYQGGCNAGHTVVANNETYKSPEKFLPTTKLEDLERHTTGL